MSKRVIKRFDVNKTRVSADVTGAGEWLEGLVIATTKSTVTFQPDDGSEPVTIRRSECFKPEPKDKESKPVAAADTLPDSAKVVELENLESDDEEEEDDDGALIRPDHSRYKHFETTTPSGRKSYDTDDFVAKTLRGLTVAEVEDVLLRVLNQCEIKHIGCGKKKVEVNAENITKRYANLSNEGMRRMCMGNLIRGTYQRMGLSAEDEMPELF